MIAAHPVYGYGAGCRKRQLPGQTGGLSVQQDHPTGKLNLLESLHANRTANWGWNLLSPRTLILVILVILAFLVAAEACNRHTPPVYRWNQLGLQPPPDETPPTREQPSDILPPIAELDALFAEAPKGVRAAAQVVSYGADFADTGSTTGRDESVEVDDTSLSLRAYEPGDYTYALFSQEIGDGVMGGGRDDDIPLMSLLDTEVCDYGGGRDDDIPLYYFLGIADYSVGSWRWFGPYTEGGPTLEVYTDDLKNRFKSPSDLYYVVFLTASTGHTTSQLAPEGLVAALPFSQNDRSVMQEEEEPGGVRINRLVTDAEAGHATIPSIVTGLEAAVGGSSVILTWDANPDPDVLSHRVYRRDVELEPDFTMIAEIDVAAGEFYEDATAVPDTTYIYGVTAVNDAGEGGMGALSCGPPKILGVAPLSGDTGDTVTFAMTLLGSEPFTIEWAFGGGATPDSSTEEKPVVTLGDPGDYFAWVMADNALGHDSIDFVLTVNGPPCEWHIQVAASFPVEMIADVSLAEVNGNPAISYDDWSGRDLMYVRATTPDGSSWGTPVTVDSVGEGGMDCRLVVVNGNPAISYYDSTNGYLKYVRALDANGTTWGSPVVVDSSGNAGDSSLAVVNSYPAISYSDNFSDCQNFVRATDANGDSWGAPVAADSTAGVGWYNSLVFVNFAPAIAYYDHNLENLMYVRATDPNGVSWGAPVVADGVGDAGYEGISMAVVYIYPAISYPDSYPNDDLKFVRATSMVGSTWGTPVTVDSTGDVGDWSSLAIVNGRPAISYMDWTNERLKYVRAVDPYGDAWGTPEMIDGPSVSTMSSLVEINGCPAIAYCDWNTGELKFAICYATPAGDLPPSISSVAPTSGMTDEAVQFTATVQGTPTLTYEWDFGGGATPNTSTDVSPTVTLSGVAGDYSGSLTVTNAWGSDTFDFVLTVV